LVRPQPVVLREATSDSDSPRKGQVGERGARERSEFEREVAEREIGVRERRERATLSSIPAAD
jgi:hypothetical protein